MLARSEIADAQAPRDFLVAQPFGQQTQDIRLTGRER